MPSTPRLRKSTGVRALLGALATLLAAAALVVLPSSPAMAIQTIAWTAAPPATATVGSTFSFSWSGTANTFLGARITGCFATFSDGNNYVNSFQGNFTTGNCQYTNRLVSTAPTYQVVAGFTLSTGGQMTMGWTISTSAPTPTVVITPPASPIATISALGAPMPTVSAYGFDATYGTYGAGCSPAAGTMLPVGTHTITCTATNPGGATGSSTTSLTVVKSTPTMTWAPPAQVVAGRPIGTALNAAMAAVDATGAIIYTLADGSLITAASTLPAGTNTVLKATYLPSGLADSSYNSVTATRTVNVVRIPQAVTFGTVPSGATVDDDPVEVTATGTADGGTVSIGAAPGSACSVTDHGSAAAGAATVTVTGSGACVLEARQAQTATYLAAPVVQQSITVARRTPDVTWDPATTVTYGDTLADLLDATTTVPGTWAYRLNGVTADPTTMPDAGTAQVLDVTFTPTDSSRYTTATASRVLDVQQAPQHLDVSAPADRTYGDAPFDVGATSDGPGTIAVSVTGPCSVTDRTVTVIAAGDCLVTVGQAGDGNHEAADDIVRTVVITKATPTLSWDAPEDITYGDPLGATELDATVGADVDPSASAPVGDLTYTLDGGDEAPGAVLDAGDHLLHVAWEPVGTSVDSWKTVQHTVTLHVAKATPTLTWSAPAAIVYGVAIGDDQLTATVTSAVEGDLDYTLGDGSPARGAVLGAGPHTLRASFVPSGPDADNYATAGAEVDLVVLKASQAIDFDAPGPHTYGDAPFDLVATGGASGRPVTFALDPGSTACTLDGSTVSITDAGPCAVIASQDGTDDYEAAQPVTRSLTVARALPTLAWSAPQPIAFGTPLDAAQLDASVTTAGATGTITYVLADGETPADGAVLHAGAGQTLTALFEPDQASAGTYLPTSASVTIDVAKASQAIDFAALSDRTFGDPDVALQASGGDSGEPVTFTAAGVACEAAGPTLHLVHAGDCTVTADQTGTADYEPAASVDRSFSVARGSQGVALGQLADRTYGDSAVLIDVVAPLAGAPVSIVAAGPCAVLGSTVQLRGAGRCSVTASRAESADLLSASVTRTFTIAPATLTVTAPSAGRRYGAHDPAFVAAYAGFVLGDGVDHLVAPAECSSSATPRSPAGSYPVTCSGASSPDYEVATLPGTLRVRYSLRGLLRSIAGPGGEPGTIPRDTEAPVRISLRDSKGHAIPRALASAVGAQCRATIRIAGGTQAPVCFRYRAAEHRFGARVPTDGLHHGSVVDVVVQVRATDGTVAKYRALSVRVR